MKQILRYKSFTIPSKLIGELRLTIDSNKSYPEYKGTFEDGSSVNVSLYPLLNLTIVRQAETDEYGNRVKQPWNMNDSVALTKFSLPIFNNEMKQMYEEMKTPNLYTYRGEALELNEKLANKVRHVFVIGNTTLELIPAVIIQNDNPVEGIKMKFNNENSVVYLTLNEIISLIFNLDKIDMDFIAWNMFNTYARIKESAPQKVVNNNVDIKPKEMQHLKPVKFDKPADFDKPTEVDFDKATPIDINPPITE